jgi:hypothetical protein
VTGGLPVAVIVASLAVAVWSLLTALRDRAAGMTHLVGAAAVEVLALVQIGVAVAGLASGHRPDELATFIGYLAMTALIVPGGVVLSLMERSRWGAAIIGGACLVLPVLVLRLQQLWQATGG